MPISNDVADMLKADTLIMEVSEHSADFTMANIKQKLVINNNVLQNT